MWAKLHPNGNDMENSKDINTACDTNENKQQKKSRRFPVAVFIVFVLAAIALPVALTYASSSNVAGRSYEPAPGDAEIASVTQQAEQPENREIAPVTQAEQPENAEIASVTQQAEQPDEDQTPEYANQAQPDGNNEPAATNEKAAADPKTGSTGQEYTKVNTDTASSGIVSELINTPSNASPTTPPPQKAESLPVETLKPKPKKVAYITIDDGPSRAITPKILDLLEEEGIKATFFVLPHTKVDDLYQRIIDEGHEIGNHTYTHQYASLYDSKDIESFENDVLKARDFIYDKFGYTTKSFRFPGGPMGHSSAVIEPRREILKGLGYSDYSWDVDTGDSRVGQVDKSAAALTANVLKYTRGREQLIVLMHDTQSKKTTLEALPLIIKGLRDQGYIFDVLRNYNQFDVPAKNDRVHTTK